MKNRRHRAARLQDALQTLQSKQQDLRSLARKLHTQASAHHAFRSPTTDLSGSTDGMTMGRRS